jgi:hypothetical protein
LAVGVATLAGRVNMPAYLGHGKDSSAQTISNLLIASKVAGEDTHHGASSTSAPREQPSCPLFFVVNSSSFRFPGAFTPALRILKVAICEILLNLCNLWFAFLNTTSAAHV